jgi:four helix bundle protein
MSERDLKKRTKDFAIRIIHLVEALPDKRLCDVIGKQVLRAGTSVGANYRAACRARSSADFVSKMGIVEEELDECMYWMELLTETGIIHADRLKELEKEADELLSITVSSIRTARKNIRIVRRR